DPAEGRRPRPPRCRIARVPVHMKVTRRQFVKGGVAAFTVTFAAPEFLSDLARAQGARTRNLVVLYLSGGNDSLSMLVPYNDPFVGWNTTSTLPHVLSAKTAVPAIANAAAYAFASPNAGAEAAAERATALRIASHIPVDRPELAFVYGSTQAAMSTLDRVAN